MMIQNDSYRIMLTYPAAKPITNNRNTIVQKFLANDCDYLMMVDSDIIPPVMFVKQKGMLIPLFLKRGKDGIYDSDDYLTKVGLQEVDATGTGCIFIKREVLENVKHPFENRYDEDGIKILGNDFAFCQMAKEKGYRVWVHLDYVASHHSVQDLKDEFYEKLKKYRTARELFFVKEILKQKPRYYDKVMREVQMKSLKAGVELETTLQ